MRSALAALLVGVTMLPSPGLAQRRPAVAPRAVARPAAPIAPPKPVEPPVPAQLHGIQYLFGSAEAAALSRQTWRVLADYVDDQMASGGERRSVVLTAEATLANPRFVPCGDRPAAIVLDVDETAILNLGAEYDDLVSARAKFDPAAWDRWEKLGANHVAPTPGAKEALDRLRDHGVTIVFNTNRAAANADATEAALNASGLGPARHGETLFLAGDDAGGSNKDGRRQTIAAKYCVLAMGGDQLTDFSSLFNSEPNGVAARRATVGFSGVAELWGRGWFVFPNPVYGTALQGSADDIFPKDKQWRDPGPPPPPPPPGPAVPAAPNPVPAPPAVPAPTQQKANP